MQTRRTWQQLIILLILLTLSIRGIRFGAALQVALQHTLDGDNC